MNIAGTFDVKRSGPRDTSLGRTSGIISKMYQ